VIWGTRGVLVKRGVGVNVMVGVSVGNSGVEVGNGDCTISTGMTAWAVWVAPEIIVSIMAVPRELRSCVGAGTTGEAQARETINRTETDKRMGVDFFISPPFGTRQS
jgi:hypothetical protein